MRVMTSPICLSFSLNSSDEVSTFVGKRVMAAAWCGGVRLATPRREAHLVVEEEEEEEEGTANWRLRRMAGREKDMVKSVGVLPG